MVDPFLRKNSDEQVQPQAVPVASTQTQSATTTQGAPIQQPTAATPKQ